MSYENKTQFRYSSNQRPPSPVPDLLNYNFADSTYNVNSFDPISKPQQAQNFGAGVNGVSQNDREQQEEAPERPRVQVVRFSGYFFRADAVLVVYDLDRLLVLVAPLEGRVDALRLVDLEVVRLVRLALRLVQEPRAGSRKLPNFTLKIESRTPRRGRWDF